MTAKAMASGRLTKLGKDHWKSSGGLVYKGKDPQGRNRIEHVARHLTVGNNRRNRNQSVFAVSQDKLLKTLDEAWLKRGSSYTIHPKSGNWNYTIDMGRVVGVKGESKILIAVKPGTSEIVSAFPVF